MFPKISKYMTATGFAAVLNGRLQAAKDKVDKPSAAILVSPMKSEHPLYYFRHD